MGVILPTTNITVVGFLLQKFRKVRDGEMPNVRKETMKKYNVSPHRFMELYHFCLQYNEWKDELQYKTNALKSVQISDAPAAGGGASDSTARLAERRAELQRKCELIERTAIEADADIYQYILKAVTNEGISFNYLKTVCAIPCGKDMYYDRRRKFFWLLSQKI